MFACLCLARGLGIGTGASEVDSALWFFCAALVGPIATLKAAPPAESAAEAN
jgi:hypothetical protein